MRSGTTSLYRYLGAHPEVFMAPKELQFFTDHFSRGVDWYRAQFAAAGTALVLGEATADYLARQSAMSRVAATLPDAKLVASLRNPVDRAWSHYGLLRTRGREHRTFEVALDEEMAALQEHGFAASGVFYLSHGLYDVHLERALGLFDPTRLHVSIFERMAHDPATSYRALCAFLGVDTSFVPGNLGEPVNAFVTFRSVGLRRLTQRLPDLLARPLARVNTRRDVAPPQLEDGLRRRLEAFYEPHIARTRDILGDELPEWRPRA